MSLCACSSKVILLYTCAYLFVCVCVCIQYFSTRMSYCFSNIVFQWLYFKWADCLENSKYLRRSTYFPAWELEPCANILASYVGAKAETLRLMFIQQALNPLNHLLNSFCIINVLSTYFVPHQCVSRFNSSETTFFSASETKCELLLFLNEKRNNRIAPFPKTFQIKLSAFIFLTFFCFNYEQHCWHQLSSVLLVFFLTYETAPSFSSEYHLFYNYS